MMETEPLVTCEDHLTGTGFQDLIDPRLSWLKQERAMAVDKPGVFAVPMQRFPDGSVRARLIASLPDYQGVFGTPQQEVVFDAKVCSQASFDLSKYRIEMRKARSRQLKFMYERASFGSACFFLIHWNRRELKQGDSSDHVRVPGSRQSSILEDVRDWVGESDQAISLRDLRSGGAMDYDGRRENIEARHLPCVPRDCVNEPRS